MTKTKKSLYWGAASIGIWLLIFLITAIIYSNPFTCVIVTVGVFMVSVTVWAIYEVGKEVGGEENASSATR